MNLKHLHYGWVTVIMAIFILAGYGFTVYTFGIFLRPLTMEFNWDRGALSGAYSMFMIMSGFLGIFGGRLSDKYGPRPVATVAGLFMGMGFCLMSQVSSLWQVYIIWGVLLGVGGGSAYAPMMSTIPRWFARRRGIAMGIALTGLGLGGVISPPLAQWLIDSYGWRQAFIILGLITFLIVVPLAQFMRHSPQRVGLKPYGENETTDKQSSASAVEGLSFKQAIKTGRFWLLGLIIFSMFFAIQLILVHIAPYAVDIGISAMVAASILSTLLATSLIGKLSLGFICDRIGARRALTACLVGLTLSLIWLLFAKEIWMFYVFAVAFGFFFGGLVPTYQLVPTELFGLRFLGTIIAICIFCGLTGGAVGPLLAGTIFDVTGSYNLALQICVIIGALTLILSLILLKAESWRGGD